MLEIRLLGQFDVRLDGTPLAIPTRAAQSLFAYLLLNPEAVHRREKLAGIFWPEAGEANARSNLRHELWRLRKAIETNRPPGLEYILADDITIRLNPAAEYWLDVSALEARADTPAPADGLAERLALYRGPLLPGFYEDWVVLERERLQALFEQLVQHLLERLIQAERWPQVLDWGERWIALGQTPEPAYRALMVAHAAMGDMSKVAAVNRRLVESLRTELDVEPADLSRTLYERLTRQEGAPPSIPRAPVEPRRPLPLELAPAPNPEMPAPGEPPFLGLRYFDLADADKFFGRERLTATLVGHLRTYPFLLAVVGASGSGKSSLVRAGVVPALQRGAPLADGTLPPQASAEWQFLVITPTAHPLEAIALALTRDSASVTPAETLMDDLASDPRSLHLAIRRRLGEVRRNHLLLVIDQFEEVYTLCRDAFEREVFVDNLLTAVAPDVGGPTSVILALRADFYAHLGQTPALRDAVAQHQVYIGPMQVEELRRAIEEPALRGGWELEPGLADLLLREVGDEPGALPLLSHALLETWKRRRGRMLTLRGYAEAGGVRGAIALTAQTVYEKLDLPQQSIARRIFLRLTELGEGTPDTRRRAALEELMPDPKEAGAVSEVLHILAEARLITLSQDTAEVAHEALIREWPALREWLAQDREGLRLSRQMTEAAGEWERLGRDPGSLYRGARLAQAAEWAQANAETLNERERDFLAASREAARRETAELEAQQNRELKAANRLAEVEKSRAMEAHRAAVRLRRRAYYLAGAFILALVMAAAALYFGEQARTSAVAAQAQAATASARELAAAAIDNLDSDPERSLLLALEAASAANVLEAQDALHRALEASRVEFTLRGHTGEVWSVAFSPDGMRLATAGADGTARIWDALTGKPLLTLTGHTDSVSFVTFSPDGTRLATASADKTVRVWDPLTGKQELALIGHSSGVFSLAYSRDGGRIATAGRDRTVRIWDAATGNPLFTLRGHLAEVHHVAFSPDGRLLISGSADGSAMIWDTATGERRLTLRGDLFSVAFTPDGARVIAAGGQSAQVFEAATGKELLTLARHTQLIYAMDLSPRGTRLATGSQDRTAKVWDAATGQLLLTLFGHTQGIVGVAFSPDGTRLATASMDGTARVWNIGPSRELATLPLPPRSGRVGFSRDWRRMAVGLPDGAVNVWDVSTGRQALTLRGHSKAVETVAFSPDGTRLATAGDDGLGKVWEVSTGRELITLRGHLRAITGISFSPDGRRLATVGNDWAVRVWDSTTGSELFNLSFQYPVYAVSFSPDGTRLATADEASAAKIWDSTTGKELVTLPDHTDTVWAVVFSPDGSRLATASQDGTARIWDAATGRALHVLTGHPGAVVAVAFSPDNSRLATAGRDGAVRLWDVATGGGELTLSAGEGGDLSEVAFSPDGTRLAARSGDAVHLYVLQTPDLVALARTRVTRALSLQECLDYLHRERAACGPQAPAAPTPPSSADPVQGRVCQVAAVASGGIDDRSFNQNVHQGVQTAVESFNWAGTVRTSMQYSDYKKNVGEFLQSNCTLIVTFLSDMAAATQAAVLANPRQKFLMLDVADDGNMPNVWAQVYATDEAAFLAGYAAAAVTRTGKVGTFGGIPIPQVTDFMDGLALGVDFYNTKHGTNVQVLGWDVRKREGMFAGDFCCAALGQTMAEKLMDQGADIVMPVAGPAVGLGTVDAVQKHGRAYFIGVDTDWAVWEPEFAPVVLTSVEKRFDMSVVAAVKAIVENRFASGTHLGRLTTGEVGISPFHDLDAIVPAQVKSELDQIRADIIAGRLKTKP